MIGALDLSPDGKWLVYSSNLRGNLDLYKMLIGGGAPVPLTALPGGAWRPLWSPSGREIAFFATAPGSPGTTQIMVIGADGGQPSAITNNPGFNDFHAWSPSGLQLAVTSNRTGHWAIWILSRDSVGGAWHQAVRLTDKCYSPVWAPNGSGLLCRGDHTAAYDGKDLVFISRQGRELWRRNIIPTSGLVDFGWRHDARDGRTIYVPGIHRDGSQGVWAIPVAGRAPRLVIAFDDPALANPSPDLSVGADRLYLTVAQYESNIWVANLHW